MTIIRNGMWVRGSAGVGIFMIENLAVKEDGSKRKLAGGDGLREGERLVREPWVHLTNKDGTTFAEIPAQAAGELRQAKVEDIPPARIAHLSAEALAEMGYA